ncbi:hypothetical protein [Comamonas sp.]|uniref:hypothetical protein n=1 Tax=Comamonas sp. TaxID=34028 RepID=UPI002588622B|nr:hypothetical protein [Comamonas sp.]
MTTNTDFDYEGIDGALTPEQAVAALTAEQGDTSGAQATGDLGGAPATTAATDTTPAASADSTTAEKPVTTEADPADAVLLARDGKHTIPYDTLVKAREEGQHWKAQAEAAEARETAAQQQLAQLQTQAQARADAGKEATTADNLVAQTQAALDAGVDVGLFGDFSEKAMAAGIKAMNQQSSEALRAELRAEMRAELEKELAPLKQQRAESASNAHYEVIYGKHPDADSIAQSTEFKAWVDAQPSAVRAAYWGLFDANTGGTAYQIVEVFDAFKGATAPKPTTTAATDKEAASAAVASVKTPPPASLSSIPGGHAAGTSALDNTAGLSGLEMLNATAGMNPQQIEAWLNRQI